MFDGIDKTTNVSDEVRRQVQKKYLMSRIIQKLKLLNEPGGKRSRKTSRVSAVTTNGNIFRRFVLSVDGMVGREALFLLSQLS